MNPYWGCNFFAFFSLLFHRMCLWVTGSPISMASDEVQIVLLITIAVSCGFLGTFLVVRKMTMLANSLSHTILVGIVVATLLFSDRGHHLSLTALLVAAVSSSLLTVFITRIIGKGAYVKEDASIGLGFTTLFAIGLLLLMLFMKDVHIGTEAVMGNLDAADFNDLSSSISISVVSTFILFIFYPWLKSISFDRAFSTSIQLPCRLIDALFFLLLSITSVISFRIVGVLLVLGFFTGPILTARLICKKLSRLIWLSIGWGITIAPISVALARHMLSVYQMPLSTAGIAISLLGILFAITALFVFFRSSRRFSLTITQARH